MKLSTSLRLIAPASKGIAKKLFSMRDCALVGQESLTLTRGCPWTMTLSVPVRDQKTITEELPVRLQRAAGQGLSRWLKKICVQHLQ